MIAVVDYDIGNVRSVCKAVEYLGENVLLTRKRDDLQRADRIILPGVGAFKPAMDKIVQYGLNEFLFEEVMLNRKPFLGICLGMQLITNISHENGLWNGLGWLDAEVHRFLELGEFKLPQFGWNETNKVSEHDLLINIPNKTAFYFANSYHVKIKEDGIVLLTSAYSESYVAAFAKQNIFATQFHPEKSQEFGLIILENFLNWKPLF